MLITPLLSNAAGPDFPRLEWTDVVCVLLAFTWGQEPGPGSSLRGDGRGETGKEKESAGGGRRLQDIRETKQGRWWWAQKSNTEERLVFNVVFSSFWCPLKSPGVFFIRVQQNFDASSPVTSLLLFKFVHLQEGRNSRQKGMHRSPLSPVLLLHSSFLSSWHVSENIQLMFLVLRNSYFCWTK